MVKAFLFGKFLPFHKGHEAMIKFALTKCDFLTVLICCSDKELVSASIREEWLKITFQSITQIEIKSFEYKENELPNTSVSSAAVSKLWAAKFKNLFPGYEIVITSEDYGDYLASEMGIKHIAFDKNRSLYPISATAIRADAFSNWKFLPNSVKSKLVMKVVILGTESTGKSTLAEKLSKHYHCNLVTEAGRDLIDNSNSFSFNDLNAVAKEHAKRIDESILGDSPLIIIDTDVHTTMSYAEFVFKKKLKVSEDIYKSNQADLYLYLKNDVEYFQDGTRLEIEDRNLLDKSHRKILKRHNIDFVEIGGNWQERFERAVKLIDNHLITTNKKHWA